MSAAPPDESPAGGVLAPSSSLLQEALLFVALGWLFARVLSIVRQPKTELAEFIGLAEPARPVILVEGLGSTWATIYWYYPSSDSRNPGKRRPKARKYIVCIGNQVIEAAREQRRVLVEGLEPDTSYKVLVKAIQATPSHSHSHINHGSGSNTTTNGSTSTSTGIEEGISSILGTVDPGSVVVSSSIYLHTLNSGPVSESVPPLSTLLRDKPLEPISIESTKDIMALQTETRTVLEQFDASETEYGAKYRLLMQDYNAINEQRKLEESQRAHLRAESKTAEDRKYALDVQLSKLKQRATKIAKYRADIDSFSWQLIELEKQHTGRKKEHQQKIKDLESEYHTLATREDRLSRNSKELSQRLKNAERETAYAREFLNKLKDTGHHIAGQQLELLAASGESILGVQGKEIIERELHLDERIEHEWTRALKSQEQRYIDAYLLSSEKETQKMLLQSQSQSMAAAPAHESPRQSLDGTRSSQASFSRSHNSSVGPEQQTPSTPGSVKDLSNHNSVLGVNGSLLQPSISPCASAMPSYTSLQSAPSMSLPPNGSIPPFDTVPSVQSLRGMTSMPSSSPLSNVSKKNASSAGQVNSLNPFTSVGSTQPFGPPYPFGAQSFPYSSGNNTPTSIDAEEVMLSPSAARDLIPSNLFQDSDYGDLDSGDTEAALDIQETPRAPARVPNKDSSPWLPWLSPHTRSRNRSSSLFFGTANDADNSLSQSVFTSYTDTFEPEEGLNYWADPRNGHSGHNGCEINQEPDLYHKNHEHDHEHDHEQELEAEEETQLATSPSKTPRKRGGSRFFHKTGSGSKHGNFVRRLSIFSRKDTAEATENNVITNNND